MKYFITISCCLLFALISCKKEEGEERFNQTPETEFSVDEINLDGENRLNSIVKLSWYGKDPDGYVVGYEISQDGNNWTFTTSQDSTFRFALNSGSDTADIEVYVRAIDNESARDPSPDFLRVPIRNTPPTVAFDEDLTIADTAYLVATTEWIANDIDGLETITNVQISLNGAAWFDLNQTKRVFSIVPADPTASATTQAQVYYETDASPDPDMLEGLIMNDTNRIFIRAIDQAGTISTLDTSTTFFMKGKVNDVIVVGGIVAANQKYKTLLDSAGIPFDFVDYGKNNGVNQPKVWSTTFRLMINQYDKMILYSDETGYDNDYTGVKALILEFAASSIQDFANQGGKYILASSFDHDTEIDAFSGIIPIQSVSSKDYGTARFYRKSGNFPAEDSIASSPLTNFPDLTISPLNSGAIALEGVGVFNVNTSDSEVLYEAGLSDGRPTVPWPDTKIIASGRRANGKLNQVYFSVQLVELNGRSNMPDLIDYLINVEFN